ncbi:galactose oxidase [Pedobacter polaris]|uniref:Galactose oxidase n=1 Tax=Pedobacter polaris TaxID=2571273 RepID=A0A4V5NZT5_9SPHI|nr:galactose oxidase [Pedobacter polaris]TKC09892.1 galactose oxidase [Pedobacter polaris]
MIKLHYLFILLFMVTTLNENIVQAQTVQKFDWQQLPSIPDQIGFAGSFAGVAGNVLLVAGGANFPDGGAPWTGSKKAWSDQIFALEKHGGTWKKIGNLPKKMGYGVSVNYKDAFILIGGSNEQGHHLDVVKLHYISGKLNVERLPDLPQPIANTSGVLLGDVIYVMGGILSPDSKIAGNNFWKLDLSKENKVWEVLPNLPGEPRMLSVAGSLNGSIYLFSGVALVDGQRKYLTDAYQYTLKNGWKRIADLPITVAAAPTPAFASKNQLFVFGGDDGVLASSAAALKENHPGFSNQILAYDPVKNIWCKSGEIDTVKKGDAVNNPNGSIWAPVTTTLTIWKGNVILPGGEVRPATRTPNVLMAKPTMN